jgi:hypothetical protein
MPKQLTIIVRRCAGCPECWAGCECTATGVSEYDCREITPEEYASNTTPPWCPLPDAKDDLQN